MKVVFSFQEHHFGTLYLANQAKTIEDALRNIVLLMWLYIHGLLVEFFIAWIGR
jgi:hypothetical protein